MKILITGCSGFVGRNLIKHMFNKNHSYYCVNSDTDISDRAEIAEVLTDIQPDCIINLAALAVPGVKKELWEKMWKVNVDGVKNLLDFAPHGCKFIQASSITIYGHDYCNEINPSNPTSIYGASKVAAEALVDAYTNLGLVDGISLRFCAIVGPSLTHGVLKDFIRKIKTEENLEILGDYPGSIKPYLHVNDVCLAIEAAIDLKGDHPKGIIVTANNSVSIDKIADICMNSLNIKKEKVWLGESKNFAGDNREVIASNREALYYLGWYPKHEISEDAIRQAIKENL